MLRAGTPRNMTVRLEEAQSWNGQGGPGTGPWMGWMDGGGDMEKLKSKLKSMKWYDGKNNDGHVRIYRDLDDLEDMDPKERAEFEKEMRELREEMRELLRDLKDEREDDDD